MVWWDHETQSLWSQPTGTAIEGPLAGVRLDGIPAAVQRWGAWLTEHPDTSLLMDTDGILDGSLRPRDPFATASEEVAGITVASASKAWRIVDVQEIVALNDALGDIPLLVYANKDDGAVHIYVREVMGEDLRVRREELEQVVRRCGRCEDFHTS